MDNNIAERLSSAYRQLAEFSHHRQQDRAKTTADCRQ